jgi:hypothetical protein
MTGVFVVDVDVEVDLKIPFRLAEKRRMSWGFGVCLSEVVWCNDLSVHIRDPQMAQDKAQSTVNGCSLNKGCNAGLSHLWGSLRAWRVTIICGVTLLGKGMPFPAKRALQLMVTHRADRYR